MPTSSNISLWEHTACVCDAGLFNVQKLLAALDVPEEALAALAGHRIEVEARGLVAAHATYPRHVPVELILSQSGGAHDGGLHHCTAKPTRDGRDELVVSAPSLSCRQQ